MKDRTMTFPDCWEEVLPSEFERLLYLHHQMILREDVALDDVLINWTAYVLRSRAGRKYTSEQFNILVLELSLHLDWLYRTVEVDGKKMIQLAYATTFNLLPVWKSFVGPQSHGADLTFGEFRHAVTAFNRYNQDHQAQDLLALCAILYRPRVKVMGKRRRQPFDADHISDNMHALRKMPDYIQWGIYVIFAYFCEYLQTGEFIIDGSTVSFAPLFTSDGSSRPNQSIGMNAIRFTVAESGVFGSAEQLDRTPLLQVMLKVLDDKQRAEDLLKRNKTQ